MADLERLKPMPMLPVALAIIAGIIITRLTDSFWPAVIFAASAAFLGAFRKNVFAAWAIAAALGSAAYAISADSDSSGSTIDGHDRFYQGNILSLTDNNSSVSADVEITAAGALPDSLHPCRHTLIRLTSPTIADSLRPGLSITFRSRLEPIEPMTDLPDEIDPARLHLMRNVRYRTFIDPANIYAFSPSPGLRSWFIRLRDRVVDAVYGSSLKPDTKIFIAVALLGDTSDLTPLMRQRYVSAGLGHILALSGLHVGIIALLISFALWPLHAFGRRTFPALVTMLLLWAYALLTGLSPSVTRAVIMASIYLTATALQRATSPINSLAVAAIIILLADPQSLFTPGFQLSFCAVASIILFAERLNPVSRRRRLPYTVATYIAVSLSAVIGTAIPSIFYFHTFPLYFIFANIVASVLLPFLIGGAFLLTLCELTGCDPMWLCSAVDALFDVVDRSAEFIGSLPGATITNIYLPVWITAMYSLSVAAFYLWLRRPSATRSALFSALCVLTFALIFFIPSPAREPRLFLARNSYHTDLVADNLSSSLLIVTTAPQEELEIWSRARFRYRDYMGRRHIDSVIVTPATNFSTNLLSRSGQTISFGTHRLAIIDEKVNRKIDTTKVGHAIVCRGYRGDMQRVIHAVHPDTLILSYDLHPKRSARYLRECYEHGVPVIDMRQQPWNIAAK